MKEILITNIYRKYSVSKKNTQQNANSVMNLKYFTNIYAWNIIDMQCI